MSYLGMVISHAHGTGCTRRESLMCLFAVGMLYPNSAQQKKKKKGFKEAS